MCGIATIFSYDYDAPLVRERMTPRGPDDCSICYCDYLIEGFIRLMGTDNDVIGPLNLGNPCEFTIREFAEIVIEMVGSHSRMIYKPLPSDDPKQRQPDISLARETLGWEPKIELRSGLKKTIVYFDEYLSNK